VKFTRYDNTADFAADALEILLENEVQNNLPISFIKNERGFDTSNWMLSTIKDKAGSVVLTAACTPPFNIVLYETGNKPNDDAVQLLSKELKSMGFALPGVIAEQGLAHRFAETHMGSGGFHRHVSLNIMRLDVVKGIKKSAGVCRELCESDLFFMPYWEKASQEECEIKVYDIKENAERIKHRLGKSMHYVWEGIHPVSSAINSRNTENGAGISGVYTPPHFRGKGYASSLVAELSQNLLERSNKFCFLFAENPVSCGIYRKIGYYDLCVFDEIRFGDKHG